MTFSQPSNDSSARRGSARLEFRPFAAEDLRALLEGAEQFHRSFGLPAAPGLRDFFSSPDVSASFSERLRNAEGIDPWAWGFAVVERESGLVVGTAGFATPPDDQGITEIAYAVVPAFEGKGYATEAARHLVSFALRDSRVRRLRAHTLPEANASTRVLGKNGFTKVAEIVDSHDGPIWRWELERTDSALKQETS